MAWRVQDYFHPSLNYRHLRHPRTYLSMTDFSNLYCSQALQRDDYILEQVEFQWPSVSTSVIIFHPSTKLQTTASSYLSRIDSRSTSCLALLGFPRGVRIFMSTYLRLWIRLWTAAPSSVSSTKHQLAFRKCWSSSFHPSFI